MQLHAGIETLSHYGERDIFFSAQLVYRFPDIFHFISFIFYTFTTFFYRQSRHADKSMKRVNQEKPLIVE